MKIFFRNDFFDGYLQHQILLPNVHIKFVVLNPSHIHCLQKFLGNDIFKSFCSLSWMTFLNWVVKKLFFFGDQNWEFSKSSVESTVSTPFSYLVHCRARMTEKRTIYCPRKYLSIYVWSFHFTEIIMQTINAWSYKFNRVLLLYFSLTNMNAIFVIFQKYCWHLNPENREQPTQFSLNTLVSNANKQNEATINI